MYFTDSLKCISLIMTWRSWEREAKYMMRYHLKTNDFLVQCERWERVVDSAHCNIQSLKIHFFQIKSTFYKKDWSFGSSVWGPTFCVLLHVHALQERRRERWILGWRVFSRAAQYFYLLPHPKKLQNVNFKIWKWDGEGWMVPSYSIIPALALHGVPRCSTIATINIASIIYKENSEKIIVKFR